MGNVVGKRRYWEEEEERINSVGRRRNHGNIYGRDVKTREGKERRVGRRYWKYCYGRKEKESGE